MNAEELATQSCVPCRGGVAPMAADEAEGFLAQIPGWAIAQEPPRLMRTFGFKDFKQALDFVDQVGAIAEEQQHHPDIRFGWGYCEVELYTHKIKGLHENDFIMAAKINDLAR